MRASDRAVVLPGVRLTAPDDHCWTIERGTDLAVLSRVTPEVTATLSARVLPADASSDDTSFARRAEADREAEVSALEMQSVHYKRSVLGGAMCLAYDGVYRDPRADPARQFHARRGCFCRHPHVRTQAVRLEITWDSASRAPPEAEYLISVAGTFFNSVVFTR